MSDVQNMKVKFFIFLFIMKSINTFGQNNKPKTEIIIIGTIHTGNNQFGHKSLYKYLKNYNPDIILWEQSNKFKRVFGLKTAFFLGIAKPEIEQLALQKYSQKNKKVQILPYDTVIISRKNYIKSFVSLKQNFYDNLFLVKKTFSDSVLYADFTKKYKYYYSFIDTSTLFSINQNDIIDKSEELARLEETTILNLGKTYITDSTILKNFENEVKFWNNRNDFMVGQILKYSQQFRGKRIIILAGLNHKYYLRKDLQKNDFVSMKEFEIKK